MSVHKKLAEARVRLQKIELRKSGKNSFQGYSYFTLDDFLPHINQISNDVGICGVISFTAEMASLVITDVSDGTSVTITSPMADAQLKGAHPIQQLGAVETYQRRYLWMTAFEIIEHEAIDGLNQEDNAAPEPPKDKPRTPTKIAGQPGRFQLTVKSENPENTKEWCLIVADATTHMLQLATSTSDVMEIFKVNRKIYDKLKEIDADIHSDVVAMFSTRKKEFA